MQQKRVFNGKFSTLHDQSEDDIFIDVTSIMIKSYNFELRERYELDYFTNVKHRCLTIVNVKEAIEIRMVECREILSETLFNNERLMRDYDISEIELEAMMKNYPSLKADEPKKMVYRYRMELTLFDDADEEFLNTGLGILAEIN